MNELVTYDTFEPGKTMGEAVLALDESHAQSWQKIFGNTASSGASESAEGAGLLVAMMMRAYLAVVTPRPPGNVHARQRFRLHALPRQGEAVRTVISCEGKEIKRERRYVELLAQGTGDDGRAIYEGRLSLIWAA
jgi:hypothetical protein